LVVLGRNNFSYSGFLLGAVRNLEAELRDELTRLGLPAVPAADPGAAPPAPGQREVEVPSQAAAAAEAGEKREEKPEEKKPEKDQPDLLQLTPKVAPPTPPPSVKATTGSSVPAPVRKESSEKPSPEVPGVVEAKEENPKERAASSGRKRRESSHKKRRGELPKGTEAEGERKGAATEVEGEEERSPGLDLERIRAKRKSAATNGPLNR
jgi:outer membrane biosynthesis protein TonB